MIWGYEMGAIIKETAVSSDENISSSIDHAVNAAQQCILNSGIDKNDIDLIINIGIYRDENISEPAMAPLIQKRLGINTNYSKGRNTFSFDLINGGCGFLYAARVVDSLFKNNAIRKALIVSSDMHPSQKQVADFPFTHIGAAVLLEKSETYRKGFQEFGFRTAKNDYDGITGYNDIYKCGNDGRNRVIIDVSKDYSSRLKKFTVDSLKVFYQKYDAAGLIDVSKLKLLTSVPARGFAKSIVDSISAMKENKNPVICLYDEYGDPHSSALSIAFHTAFKERRIEKDDLVLFIGAGSGLTVAAGLYIV